MRRVVPLMMAVMVCAGSAEASRTARVRVAGRAASGQVVMVGSHEALRLPAWSNVEDVVVSPSQHHALVYAFLRPHEPRTAFVLDLDRASVAGSFRPGVGGTFSFSATDTVIQFAGCGTECVTLQLHDARGKKLGDTRVCRGFDDDTEISPDRRMVACVGDGEVSVIDAATGLEVTSVKVPCRAVGRPSVAFQPSGVRISSACEDRASEAVVLKALRPPTLPLR